jgi:hypothetical protein
MTSNSDKQPANQPNETPLCPAHKRLDERGTLEMTIGGNNCVACSLNERKQLLDLLAPFAPKDASEDSLTVLRRLAEFYATHQGKNRVVVSYPAPPIAAETPALDKLPCRECREIEFHSRGCSINRNVGNFSPVLDSERVAPTDDPDREQLENEIFQDTTDSAFASRYDLASGPVITVEDALVELREMFPNDSICLSVDSFGAYFTRSTDSGYVYPVAEGVTLTDCLQAIRDWAEKGKRNGRASI